MKFESTKISDVKVITPDVFTDERGYFMETWQRQKFADAGISAEFVQDNHSRSAKGTLRGLHYQLTQPQGKLVRVVNGAVFDVAVDTRSDSPSFGEWVGVRLTAENRRMLWVPPGFAHGFYVTSEYADFIYKCSEYYCAADERSIIWNDPDLAIRWPIAESGGPILSSRDASAPRFRSSNSATSDRS